MCVDGNKEQRVGVRHHETVKERKARSSMGCLLGICVVSRNASGARTCAPSGVLENRLCPSFPCAKSWAAFGHAGGSKGEGGCTVDVGYGAYLGERDW
jgi:hypothetical protein